MKKIVLSIIVSLSLIANAQATALYAPYAVQNASKNKIVSNKTLITGAAVVTGLGLASSYIDKHQVMSNLPTISAADFQKIYDNPSSVIPYLKKNPRKEHDVIQVVVANLNNPRTVEEYQRFGEIGGYIGLPGFTPPPKNEKPTVLANPIAKPELPKNTGKPVNNLDSDIKIPSKNKADPLPALEGKPYEESEGYKKYILERNKAESKELAKNMKNAGMGPKPKDYAAHHVVPWNDPWAANSRKVLKRFDVDISDADNGIYLPNTKDAASKTNEAYHREIHTKKYFNEIEERLSFAQNKKDVQNILSNIKDALKNNTFPY